MNLSGPARDPFGICGVLALTVCSVIGVSVACGDDDGPFGRDDEVAIVEFTTAPLTLELGSAAVQLTFEIRDDNGDLIDPDDVTIDFSTNSATVATVSETGLVTAIGVGSATITIEVGSVTDTISVTVVPEISSINIVGPEVLFTEETLGLQIIVLDGEGNPVTDPVLTFTSSDPAVVSVDPEGLVTGGFAGTATITVTSGDESDTFEITVLNAASGGLTLIGRSFTVQVGDETLINNLAIVSDAGGVPIPGARRAFSTSDAGIVTVDAAGLLVAHGPGDAVITVMSPDAPGSAEMLLKVIQAGSVDLVELDPTTATIAVNETADLLLNVEVDGTRIFDFLVSFSSSDESVAVVVPFFDLSDFPIGLVTGVASGTATITAATGGLTAETVITVQ